MRLEPRAAPEIGLQPSPLASYNRPAAGVPVRLSRTPGHVRGPAGGPMLLNSRGPILLTIDSGFPVREVRGAPSSVTGCCDPGDPGLPPTNLSRLICRA